jgi:tRNA threonylcarbamoyladenosine modification (KEOPS) complex Cgi121 subunit
MMTRRIVAEYGKHIRILGYRLCRAVDPRAFIGAARVALSPVVVQFFDADTVAGTDHLFFAALNALKSYGQGRGIAQTLDIEILLYVSCQGQIGEAIRRVGLTPETRKVAVVVVGDDEHGVESAVDKLGSLIPGSPDQLVLSCIDEVKAARLMTAYGVDEAELDTLLETGGAIDAFSWLIIERAALLDARR